MTKLIISKFSITIFLAMLVLFCSFTTVHGQQLKVKGTVTGDGSLLPGVSVSVKGDQVGSVTDFDGNFEIPANKDDVLVFSYIGFKTLEITAIESSMEINLSSDVSKLDEVVVVGYGSVKRKDLTGAVSTIKSEEIEKIKSLIGEERFTNGRFDEAIALFDDLVKRDTFTEFLTQPAYKLID